ncbi:LOW QUALITY PROTEIN: protein kintoun-like [Haliotis rubra]|uniref:LOW QUALITY PROTEIN: protein kintoun-like n=1 Tax=Haliotis rubra TaxID=36100 RepID=UPI001EE5DB68|nr:LOW QUALITY PROTEIN: protein kintoun-like [Haliotis rubra]
MASKKLEDLNVTQDELKRIGDALKDENFRKLFLEYAQEISDPENRRLYEQEISQMENERGMNVEFIHPKPGHVLETSVNGTTKAFINICHNDKLAKPTNTRQMGPNGKSGVMWQIPHSLSPLRDDQDKGEKCQVFDAVFHPDTYRMSETNDRFLKLVHDTAIDAIEKQFDVKLDRQNIKRTKMDFKGIPQASVIRTKQANGQEKSSGTSEAADILKNMPYPYDDKTTAEKMKERDAEIAKREEEKKKKEAKTKKSKAIKESKATVPEYTITHRSDLDLQEYRNAPDARTSTRPKDLVVKVFLPLLTSAGNVDLDVFEQRLKVESQTPAAYKLDIKLPYNVVEDEGSAKFDKTKKCLTITLPVVPLETPKLPSFIEDEKRINGDAHDTSENEISESPKIEVLSSLETQADKPDETAVQDLQESNHTSEKPVNSPPQSAAFSLPDYTYNQDHETISFIFNVRNISSETVTNSFPDSNSIRISFVSIGSGCFPMYYSTYLKFDPSCKLASDHCTTDLSEMNLVLVLLKDKSCRGMWDRFEAGVDAAHLEEKLLLTDVSLQRQLSELDEEAEELELAKKHPGQSPYLQVTEMKDKKLAINIRAPLQDEEDNEYDTPSSADIEVVHKKALPKLHSILKQRTLSESSDDHLCSGGESRSSGDARSGGESPRSGPEDSPLEGCSKKCVTFNSHIDSATYKKNTAPTSMKTALKSKRRRARKKEEKKANGRRRKNSGSEGSSGEELSHDSHSPAEDKEEDDHFEQIAEEEEGEKVEGKKGRKVDAKGAGEGSVKAEKDNKDFRTSASSVGSEMSVCEKKKKMVEAIKTNVAACDISQAADSDDDGNDDDVERTCIKAAPCVNDVCEKNENQAAGKDVRDATRKSFKEDEEGILSRASSTSDAGDLRKVAEAQDSSVIKIQAEEDSDIESGKCNESQKIKAPLIQDVEECNKGDNSSNPGDSKIETVLSWEEHDSGLDPNDHKTQCAFSFSNSVIYDLDVD